MAKPITLDPPRILDFDIENRPLSYLGQDFTTSDITAIAASFGQRLRVHCWLLGQDDPLDMLKGFVKLYDQADVVTGHYIRKHDLPIINGALLEFGLPGLKPKLSCDTKLDLLRLSGVSKSQESLAAMLGLGEPKVYMSQTDWRAANRLERLDLTERRVIADVRQHQAMRLALTERGLLRSMKIWQP